MVTAKPKTKAKGRMIQDGCKLTGNASMEAESSQLGHSVRTRWRGRFRWNGLQGKHFASSLRPHGYTVGYRVSMDILHRIFIQHIQGESAVVFITFQKASSFQKTCDPLADGVQ